MTSVNFPPLCAEPLNKLKTWCAAYRAFWQSLYYQFHGDISWIDSKITSQTDINIEAEVLNIGEVQWPDSYEEDEDYILTQINDRFYWTKLSEYGMIGNTGQIEWTVSTTAPDGWENLDTSIVLDKLQCASGNGYDILATAGSDTELYTQYMLPYHTHNWYYGPSSGSGQDPTRASIQYSPVPLDYEEFGNITTLLTDPKAVLAGTYTYDSITIKQPTISLNTIIKV